MTKKKKKKRKAKEETEAGESLVPQAMKYYSDEVEEAIAEVSKLVEENAAEKAPTELAGDVWQTLLAMGIVRLDLKAYVALNALFGSTIMKTWKKRASLMSEICKKGGPSL